MSEPSAAIKKNGTPTIGAPLSLVSLLQPISFVSSLR
jgi:hypothetical protein